MAELKRAGTPTKRTPRASVTPAGDFPDATVVADLRARVAELEQLVEARTQAIVGMGARLAELQGDAPPALAERVKALEAELDLLKRTKVLRYSAVPRRLYGRLRRGAGG